MSIAFSYFTRQQYQERGFNVKELIVLECGDPISNFASNFIYHCCSLIKNRFTDAKQLIISTQRLSIFQSSHEVGLSRKITMLKAITIKLLMNKKRNRRTV